MRIGEFAKKHNVTQDTIRHYLEMDLLAIKKSGGQYKFSEDDSRDMETIIELKHYGFSLSEIQKIITFQRISGTNSEVFRNFYLKCLEKKKVEVAKKITKYNKLNTYIKSKIHNIKSDELISGKKLGYPLSSLHILKCPKCRCAISLTDGLIENNMLMEANFYCNCGYKGLIKNGIYIDEKAVRTKFLNGKKMLTKEEYLNSSTSSYNNFLYMGMTTIIDYLKKYKTSPKYILELDNCVGFFLMQYIKNLSQDSTYILIDYDLERLTDLKMNLEMYSNHNNFIFLCCDYDKIPLNEKTVDVIIDYQTTKVYAQDTSRFLLDETYKFLNQNGLFLSAFNYYYNKENLNELHIKHKEYYNKDKIIEKFKDTGLKTLEVGKLGPITEYSSLFDEKVEICQGIYAGEK